MNGIESRARSLFQLPLNATKSPYAERANRLARAADRVPDLAHEAALGLATIRRAEVSAPPASRLASLGGAGRSAFRVPEHSGLAALQKPLPEVWAVEVGRQELADLAGATPGP